MCLVDNKLTPLPVNFYIYHEKLIILILDSINRSRIFGKREVIILYSSKSIVFHSGQHTLNLKTKARLFVEVNALRGERAQGQATRKGWKDGTEGEQPSGSG